MADQRKADRPKVLVWQRTFQDKDREHKQPSVWLNDMMTESKDG